MTVIRTALGAVTAVTVEQKAAPMMQLRPTDRSWHQKLSVVLEVTLIQHTQVKHRGYLIF